LYLTKGRTHNLLSNPSCIFNDLQPSSLLVRKIPAFLNALAISKHPPPERVYNLASMTEQIKRKLQDEINALEHELVHELPKEIKKAAALGDLSENAEYHMAKQRQEFVKARVRQLGKRLAELSMVNMNNIPKDRIGLGSTVKVYDTTKNEEVEYNLVTSEESDVGAGKISTTSPIGRALLNKKVGDTAVVVTPNGKREMEVLSLMTIHDGAPAE
jgi:transcription elongation factor GreA